MQKKHKCQERGWTSRCWWACGGMVLQQGDQGPALRPAPVTAAPQAFVQRTPVSALHWLSRRGQRAKRV